MAYCCFAPKKGQSIFVSIQAVMEVMRRHKLKVDKEGNFHLTDAMVAEAQAIDAANGTQLPSPALQEDFEAAAKNHPEPHGTGWEEDRSQDFGPNRVFWSGGGGSKQRQ
jgi:hypothetical protein